MVNDSTDDNEEVTATQANNDHFDEVKEDEYDLSALVYNATKVTGTTDITGMRLLFPAKEATVATKKIPPAQLTEDEYGNIWLHHGCIRINLIFLCNTSKLMSKDFDEDGVNNLLFEVIHTAFNDYEVVIVDIQHVRNVNTSPSKMADGRFSNTSPSRI